LNVYAQWTFITYTITYTNCINPGNPVTYNVATPTFSLIQPTSAGQTFVGWTGTDISGTLPHLAVSVPTGSMGNRTYAAHWAYRFATDTVESCSPAALLRSGHDAESYEWILPDGTTQNTVDLAATVTGQYILKSNYGLASIITVDTVYVLFAFELDTQIKEVSGNPTKTGVPLSFTVPINPIYTGVSYSWSFADGTPVSSASDTATVVYNNKGVKTVSVEVTVTRGALVCRKTFTLDIEIFPEKMGFFVDQNVIGGRHDGSSWDNAYLRVEEALSHARAGDYIWVADGEYAPPAGTSYLMQYDSVEIYGGFGGWETYLYERDFGQNKTVLNGSGTNVITTNGVSSAARWDGFIVEDGRAANGAGIRNINSSVTLANMVIRSNAATDGGGLYNNGGAPVLYNVEISGNTAANGAGMYNVSSNPVMTNVTVSGNRATGSGGGLYNAGSNPVIRNAIIWDNRVADGGTSPNIANSSSAPNISYSIVEGSGGSTRWSAGFGVDGSHNIDIRPLFRVAGFANDGSMQAGDYGLTVSSPAIDNGRIAYIYDHKTLWTVELAWPDEILSGARRLEAPPFDLAFHVRIENDMIDMGAYEFGGQTVSQDLSREIILPAVEGISTDPPQGVYYILSSEDFTFTVYPKTGYSLERFNVTTNVPIRDQEGLKRVNNDDGSVTITIQRITEHLVIDIYDIVRTAADTPDGNRVWSHESTLYISAAKPDVARIYLMSGALYREVQVPQGETKTILPQGFYTVSLAGKVYKIVIR